MTIVGIKPKGNNTIKSTASITGKTNPTIMPRIDTVPKIRNIFSIELLKIKLSEREFLVFIIKLLLHSVFICCIDLNVCKRNMT